MFRHLRFQNVLVWLLYIGLSTYGYHFILSSTKQSTIPQIIMVLGKRKSVGAALAMTGSKRRKLSVCSDYTVSQTLDQTSNPFAAM